MDGRGAVAGAVADPELIRGEENILSRISSARDALRPAERKVAACVMDDARLVLRMNLATFAARAGVSEPTVIRFCRALDCDGLPDFKLRLAQSLAVGVPYVHREVTADDDLATVCQKIISSSISTFTALSAALDLAAIERATEALSNARRIECYGAGLSSVAAMDAHQKLMRLGVPAQVHVDTHLQTMSASTLRPGDVALCISYVGDVGDTVRTARVAHERGAYVIGITRSGTALAEHCDVTICVDTAEDNFVYAPMTTRLAHLAVVDILATAVAVRGGPGVAAQFRRVKESLEDLRVFNTRTRSGRRRARPRRA